MGLKWRGVDLIATCKCFGMLSHSLSIECQDCMRDRACESWAVFEIWSQAGRHNHSGQAFSPRLRKLLVNDYESPVTQNNKNHFDHIGSVKTQATQVNSRERVT